MNDDLISRKALKKALEVTQYNDIDDLTRTERLIDNAPTVSFMISPDYVTELQNLNKELIRQLEEAERSQGEWIPVSERLPEEETDVLVCNINGDVTVSRGSYSTEMKDEYIWYTIGWRFGKVIAWMPLPEPYKEAENE